MKGDYNRFTGEFQPFPDAGAAKTANAAWPRWNAGQPGSCLTMGNTAPT